MKKKMFYMILAINLILIIFPQWSSYAGGEDEKIIKRVYTDKQNILEGDKNIDYNISYIYIEHEPSYKVDGDKFDLKNLHNVIKIIANGKEQNHVDSNGNFKYTIEYNNDLNRVEIKIKENPLNPADLKPFILTKDTYYNIYIPSGFFFNQSRSSDSINYPFATNGEGINITQRGIYKFEVTNKKEIVGSYDRPFLITDFTPTNKNMEFTITGYNFSSDIKQLRFVREKDNKTITIPRKTGNIENLKFHDVTKITGTMDDEAKKEFAKVINDKECKKTYTNAGVYDIYIDFEIGNSATIHKVEQRVIVKDRPKVIDTTPRDEHDYFDPEILYEKFTNPEEKGYYIKVVFEDIGSTLKMKDSISHGIQVNVIGDKTNLIDKNKQIIYKRELSTNKYSTNRFNIYIPLIDKLDDNQKYEVYIPEDSIVEYSDIETEQNRCYKWTFSTNYFPKAERLYEGSIPEYYDWNYPIVIDGSMFHDDTFVEFRNMNGKYYSPSSIDIRNNNSTMYIYLPRNRRLPVGVYDIIVSNGNSYETQMVYGVFSVVEEGDYIPNEEYRVKDDSSTGMVKGNIGKSKDVLELSSKYTDNRYLEIDLDELMGSNTWVRSIEYPISYRDSLGELRLKSKWVNVSINSLRLSNNYDERYIELRVGKVEPSMADILKKKLVGKNIKSNFIEVSGSNFDFTNLTIDIPYFDSDGNRLRILRYDESNRRFEDVPYIIDLINGKVKGMSSKPGIFVIVQ
ncbi:hypothetical protein [Tissierella praeacuta]|uniref:hypothetical protein n=1 Tax=Tissierella praeacuta TaxID=43131 RepID=UPI001C1085CF|nr:hypothetical protein [Tissierella praeacuta]MBU5255521.1 hypothetical protein [Tissierella praeacuta]